MPFYSWTIAGPRELNIQCGYDGVPIPEGEPVQEIRHDGLTRVLLRCINHAHGDIDWQAIDAARHAVEAKQAADREAARVEASQVLSAPTRLYAPNSVRSFAALGDLPFDVKAKAARSGE